MSVVTLLGYRHNRPRTPLDTWPFYYVCSCGLYHSAGLSIDTTASVAGAAFICNTVGSAVIKREDTTEVNGLLIWNKPDELDLKPGTVVETMSSTITALKSTARRLELLEESFRHVMPVAVLSLVVSMIRMPRVQADSLLELYDEPIKRAGE